MKFMDEVGKPNGVTSVIMVACIVAMWLFWFGGFDMWARLALLAASWFLLACWIGCTLVSMWKGGDK